VLSLVGVDNRSDGWGGSSGDLEIDALFEEQANAKHLYHNIIVPVLVGFKSIGKFTGGLGAKFAEYFSILLNLASTMPGRGHLGRGNLNSDSIGRWLPGL